MRVPINWFKKFINLGKSPEGFGGWWTTGEGLGGIKCRGG